MLSIRGRHRFFPAGAAALLAFAVAGAAAIEHRATDEGDEVAFLVRRGGADAFATASVLAHLVQVPDEAERTAGAAADPTELIRRAVALAPDRPELLWLELRDCQIAHCPSELRLAERLRAVDPDNGLAWLPELRAAEAKSPVEVTAVLDRIAAARATRIYWNRLAAMMFDALTHPAGDPPTAITRDPDDRLTHVIGVLAALDVPVFQGLARACQSDQFAVTDRRAACERVAARLEASDSVIAQNVSFTLLQNILPTGGEAREALQRKHRQQRYMTVESNRLRPGRADADADMRVTEMRRLPREQDVEAAMLAAFHAPLERPAQWQAPAGAP